MFLRCSYFLAKSEADVLINSVLMKRKAWNWQVRFYLFHQISYFFLRRYIDGHLPTVFIISIILFSFGCDMCYSYSLYICCPMFIFTKLLSCRSRLTKRKFWNFPFTRFNLFLVKRCPIDACALAIKIQIINIQRYINMKI